MDDSAGERPDVGPAVAADLRLVVNAAQRNADELPSQSAADGVAEGGLAGPRRAGETEDRPLRVRLQLADGEVFDDSFLRLLQAVVVLVQHAPRLFDIEVVLGALVPGERRHPVEVGRRDGVFRRRGMHFGEPGELAFRLLFRLFREVLLFDLCPVLLDLDLLVVRLSELLADRAELLAEVVLPLALVHVVLHLGLDLAAQFKDLHLVVDQARHLAETLLHVEDLEELLFLLDRRVDHGGDDVGQDAGFGDRLGHCPELLGEEGRELHDPLEEADEVRHQRLDLDVLGLPVLQILHAGAEVGLSL
jgi:hypothetical protein